MDTRSYRYLFYTHAFATISRNSSAPGNASPCAVGAPRPWLAQVGVWRMRRFHAIPTTPAWSVRFEELAAGAAFLARFSARQTPGLAFTIDFLMEATTRWCVSELKPSF